MLLRLFLIFLYFCQQTRSTARVKKRSKVIPVVKRKTENLNTSTQLKFCTHNGNDDFDDV